MLHQNLSLSWWRAPSCRNRSIDLQNKTLWKQVWLIDTLQHFCRIEIRQNIGNLEKMRNSIKGSLFHVSEYYVNCPRDKNIWCNYQHDKTIGKVFTHPKMIHQFMLDLPILPIYNDLTKRESLMKCLHNKTLNAYESFNGMIWERIPKFHYLELQKQELGVYDAIAIVNPFLRNVVKWSDTL